eukprot:sb/3477674/
MEPAEESGDALTEMPTCKSYHPPLNRQQSAMEMSTGSQNDEGRDEVSGMPLGRNKRSMSLFEMSDQKPWCFRTRNHVRFVHYLSSEEGVDAETVNKPPSFTYCVLY